MIFKFEFFPFNEDEMQRPEIYSRQNIITFVELMMRDIELKHTILYCLFEKYTFLCCLLNAAVCNNNSSFNCLFGAFRVFFF